MIPAASCPTTRAVLALPLALVLAAVGCNRERSEREREHIPAGRRADVVRTSELHPGLPTPGVRMPNPFAGSEQAARDGERYFLWFNCAGCHGALGGGGIGPPLRDEDWIYGGADEQIYMSILQGRPNGMPAYGGRIPDEVAWQIVAYVRSLGGDQAADGSSDDGTQSPTEAEGGSD